MSTQADPLIGGTLLHYAVLRKIGAGGMGAVYQARDLRLQRLVALKMLPPDRIDDPQWRERLRAEARSASALNHPNIVTIHDIVSDGGVDFIVMEYVEGQPLDAVLRAGALQLPIAIDYALQIADAIAAAHEAGVIHRDLKPANIIVTKSGRIRVLDFGLAKLARTSSLDSHAPTVGGLTSLGLAVGTLHYMAPEQSLGGPVDHRADIFSFGVLLYEIVAGVRPFDGTSPAMVLHALHFTDPVPLDERVPTVPRALHVLIHQLISKSQEARPQNMAVVYGALKSIAAGRAPAEMMEWDAISRAASASPPLSAALNARMQPPAPGSERTSLTILPFASLSPDKDDGYLAAGVTAELTTALSGIPDLRVASPLIAARYQEHSFDLRGVAESLNIRYVLTGTVRRAGNRIRVAATLTDAMPGVQVWAKSYERALEDIFAVQEDIAAQIVSATGGELIRIASERANRAAPENLDAWGLVRKAYHFWNHAFTPDGVEESLNLLRRAVELDPTYAAAHAFLALYLVQRVVNFISPNPHAHVAEALEAASRAMALAPRDPQVLENAGLVYFNAGLYETAAPALRRAVEIAPFNLVAWGYLACAYIWTGDDKEALEGRRILDRLLTTAPDHPSVPYWLYFKMSALLRFDDVGGAVDAGARCLELQPHYVIGRIEYANALGRLGQVDRAREEVARAVAMNPAIAPEAYREAALVLCRTEQRMEQHLGGLRACGWMPRT